MMALDRLPESFSPQNEFYLLCSYVPACDPRGGVSFDPRESCESIDKGPQGDAKYQISNSKPSSFREEEF